jgi:hypothetical protein
MLRRPAAAEAEAARDLMATILVFKTDIRTADGARIADRRSAEIIIFPGVRYERPVQGEPTTACRATTASRARDRLELVD